MKQVEEPVAEQAPKKVKQRKLKTRKVKTKS
jgi:hypothetical protein